MEILNNRRHYYENDLERSLLFRYSFAFFIVITIY